MVHLRKFGYQTSTLDASAMYRLFGFSRSTAELEEDPNMGAVEDVVSFCGGVFLGFVADFLGKSSRIENCDCLEDGVFFVFFL